MENGKWKMENQGSTDLKNDTRLNNFQFSTFNFQFPERNVDHDTTRIVSKGCR